MAFHLLSPAPALAAISVALPHPGEGQPAPPDIPWIGDMGRSGADTASEPWSETPFLNAAAAKVVQRTCALGDVT